LVALYKTKNSDRIPYLPSYERSLVALYKTKYSDRIRYLLSLFSPVAIKKSFNRSITDRNTLSCKGLPMTAHRRGGTGYDRNTLSCKGLPMTSHRRGGKITYIRNSPKYLIILIKLQIEKSIVRKTYSRCIGVNRTVCAIFMSAPKEYILQKHNIISFINI
jgi:hypothetical protein